MIGDGTTAALVGGDGAIDWMCVPRFDSPPLFCRILDANRGGAFVVAPEDLVESRQFYEADSAVLVTELRGRSGLVCVTDALTLHSGDDLTEAAGAGRHELLRTVEVLHGALACASRSSRAAAFVPSRTAAGSRYAVMYARSICGSSPPCHWTDYGPHATSRREIA